MLTMPVSSSVQEFFILMRHFLKYKIESTYFFCETNRHLEIIFAKSFFADLFPPCPPSINIH